MRVKIVHTLLMTVVFSFLLLSCGTDKPQLPTDIVNIPATSEEGIDRSELPVLEFEEPEFDFGTITQGEKVSHEFLFENTGSSNLVISEAYADCGCTVAEVPKHPIPPGEKSKIKVTFDSDKRSGAVSKSITVVANTMPNKHVVKIKLNIFTPQPQNK